MLFASSLLLDLPSARREPSALAPHALNVSVPTLETPDSLKRALKHATSPAERFTKPGGSALSRATVLVAADCNCWLWSDPHVETCDGTTANFNPKGEPIHTVAEGGGITLQSYHCPVVQETCRPDYYPCDASAAVAFAGEFVDAAGATHTVLFYGQRVFVDGKEIYLGVTYDWKPKAVKVGDGCTLERKLNRVVDPKQSANDTVKMTGNYETSFSCEGGAKVTTWYYEEEHMPTGFLMNALVEVGGMDTPGLKGLCHSVKGEDAKPPKDDLFENDDITDLIPDDLCKGPPTTTMPPPTTTMRPTTTESITTTTTTKPKVCFLAEKVGQNCAAVCAARASSATPATGRRARRRKAARSSARRRRCRARRSGRRTRRRRSPTACRSSRRSP